MSDQVPDAMMTPERVQWARGLGLAQSIPKAIPEAVARPALNPAALPALPAATDVPMAAAPIAPQLVGETITGRDWIVLQLPAGRVRSSGDEPHCRTTAKHLAITEGGRFGVFQPKGITRPETTVTEELL